MANRKLYTVSVDLKPWSSTVITTKIPLPLEAPVALLLEKVKARLPHLGFSNEAKISLLNTVKENDVVLFPEDELNLVYEGGQLTISAGKIHTETEAAVDEKADQKMDIDEPEEEEVLAADDPVVFKKKSNMLIDERGKLQAHIRDKLLVVFGNLSDDGCDFLTRDQMKVLLSKAYDWSDTKMDTAVTRLLEEFGGENDCLGFDALLDVYRASAQTDMHLLMKELMALGIIDGFPIQYQLLHRCRTAKPRQATVPNEMSLEQFKEFVAEDARIEQFQLPKVMEAPTLPHAKCFCSSSRTTYIEPELLYCPIASDNPDATCPCPKKHLTRAKLNEQDCSICMEPCENQDGCSEHYLVRGKCGHTFHASCFKKYYWNSSKKCPLCKEPWKFENEDRETYTLIVYGRGEETGDFIPFEIQVTEETCGAELYILLKQKGAYQPEKHLLTFSKSSLGKVQTIMPSTQSSLKTLKIGRGSCLALCERRAHPFNMTVKIECQGKPSEFRMTSNTNISDVLQRLSAEITLNRQYPVLLHKGKVLSNFTLLSDITSRTMIELDCRLEDCGVDLDLFTNRVKLPSNSHASDLLIDYVNPYEIIYVSKRLSTKDQKLATSQDTTVAEVCTKELSWLPVPSPMSDKGMSLFLACMYKLSDLDNDDAKRLTGHVRRLMVDWPPLSNALHLIAKKKFQQISIEEKSVISNGLFFLIKLFMKRSNGKVEDSNLFEHVRVFLSALVQSALQDDSKYENFETVFLTCDITQNRVRNPILHNGKLYSKESFVAANPDVNEEDFLEAKDIGRLLKTYPRIRQILRWSPEKLEFEKVERSLLDMTATGLRNKAKLSKAFPFVPPLNLSSAVPPSITMVKNGVFAVFESGQNKNGGITLMNPLTGGSTMITPETLAMDVTEAADFVDERDILEGIYIVLDVSQSMSKHCGFTDRKGLKVGTWVMVGGLRNSRHYNGKIGQICNVMRNERWPVKLIETGKILTVRPKNLKVERNCDYAQGWDSSPLGDLDTEEEKADCLKRFEGDPMLKMWLKAVEVYESVCRNKRVALKMVLEEISAIYKMRDLDNHCAMARMITKYQDEFAEILKTVNPNAVQKEIRDDEIGFLFDEDQDKEEEEQEEELPYEFICPITRDIFEDPVVAEDGNTYERRAVERWFRQCHSSPMFGTRIGTRLVTNQNLKSQIQDWQEAKAQKKDDAADAEEDDLEEPPNREKPTPLQVFVKCNGNYHTLHLQSSDTVSHVLSLMQDRVGIPKKYLSLQHNGITIQKFKEHLSLQQMKIQNEQNLQVQVSSWRIRKSDPVCVNIELNKTFIGTGSLDFMVQEEDTFEMLAWRVWCTAIKKARTDERCYRPSKVDFWKDLKASGDNFQTGTLINFEQPVRRQFQGSGWNSDERKMSLELYKAEGKSREKRDYMTRLEAVKQLFQAFINRSQGYNYANHIGLITFGDDVDIKCKISPAYERFRNSLQRVHTNGDTRLFDAMKVAVDELLKWQKKYPEAKLRMLVLSDGADTNSEVAPSELARGMQDNNITCDAVCIGGESDKQLHCLAKCSGGYCFNPKTLVSALRLNELETMLSQCERPPKGEIRLVHNPQSLESFLNAKEDVCSDDVIPPRKEIDVVHQPVRALEDILKIQPEISGLSGINRKKRILKELKRLHKQPHPSVDVFPCETDMNFLQLLFEGPADTPYAGGVWLVDVVLPEDFPDVAPTLRFRTPIKHCNINMYGRVCHAIFGRGWSADTSLKMVIECVYGLFLNPEFDDPLDSALAAEYYEASGTYEFSIKEHTAKNFKHTREEWNAILSKEASDEERTELALKRDLIRRAEKPYIQKPDDFCFGCREKTNTLKRCACHLAVFCKKRFNHCKSISDHDCVCK